MADLKPFEVIMRIYPIAGQNGKGEVCMKAERVSELVRCKDCKYWCNHKRLNIPWCRELHIDIGAEDFCSMAKRRE